MATLYEDTSGTLSDNRSGAAQLLFGRDYENNFLYKPGAALRPISGGSNAALFSVVP
jgi:hypothetical protein